LGKWGIGRIHYIIPVIVGILILSVATIPSAFTVTFVCPDGTSDPDGDGICTGDPLTGTCPEGLSLNENGDCTGPTQESCLDAAELILDPKGSQCVVDVLCPPSFEFDLAGQNCKQIAGGPELCAVPPAVNSDNECIVEAGCAGDLPPGPDGKCISVPIKVCPPGSVVDPITLGIGTIDDPIVHQCIAPGNRTCPVGTDYVGQFCLDEPAVKCPAEFTPTEDVFPICVKDPSCPPDTSLTPDGTCVPLVAKTCPEGFELVFDFSLDPAPTCTASIDPNCPSDSFFNEIDCTATIPNSGGIPESSTCPDGGVPNALGDCALEATCPDGFDNVLGTCTGSSTCSTGDNIAGTCTIDSTGSPPICTPVCTPTGCITVCDPLNTHEHCDDHPGHFLHDKHCSVHCHPTEDICTGDPLCEDICVPNPATTCPDSSWTNLGLQCTREASCPSGFVNLLGTCEGTSSCPSGFTNVAGTCFKTSTCRPGFNAGVGGLCFAPANPSCPTNFDPVLNTCIGFAETSCPAGQVKVGLVCVQGLCPEGSITAVGVCLFPACPEGSPYVAIPYAKCTEVPLAIECPPFIGGRPAFYDPISTRCATVSLLNCPQDTGDNLLGQCSGVKIPESQEDGVTTQPKLSIPDWIKNTAGWWSERSVDDSDFTGGISYLIEEDIISIPDLPVVTEAAEENVPDWVRNMAGWWADNLTSDQEFADAIKYLVEKGIIQVQT